jgi:hypothetical protein
MTQTGQENGKQKPDVYYSFTMLPWQSAKPAGSRILAECVRNASPFLRQRGGR